MPWNSFAMLGKNPQIAIARCPSPNDVVLSAREQAHLVVIPVRDLNKAVMNAIRYAGLLVGKPLAVHVQTDGLGEPKIKERWQQLIVDIPLVVLCSTDASVIQQLRTFVDEICRQHTGCSITLLLPVVVGYKWWHRFLHNQTARLIEKALLGKAGVVTIRVPFFLTDDMTGT